ncbi:MAG: amino acid permease [Chloroflexi bacterium]|nr:amino acid permease [Chloroflexota bacterium]
MTRSSRPRDDRRVDPLLGVREKRRGKRPGDAYVRIVRPFEEAFHRGGEEGELIATERTVLGRPGWTRALRRLRTVLIGRPIHSDREEHERLTKVKGLAIFSSDNISSSAYGPEEIMRVLALAGTGALTLTLPLAGLITVMLAIVTLSYRQTIKAYPHGASSYIVASDNLGSGAGVLAAAALLIGYVVTVAVSVSAGVAALTSILPGIYDERVLIGVVMVLLLMVGNLRGIRESGTIFMIPTYAYIVVMLGIIGYGIARTIAGDVPTFEPPPAWEGMEQGSQAIGLFLILRAFSQGAVALTGVEAISDGVPAFKAPEWKNARTTLTWAAIVFAILFIGIAFLLTSIGIVPDPTEQQTILSLLVRHLTGDGVVLVVAQIATALILVLAANTSFADFPRLSSFLARDGYLPRQFAFRGERLAFTTGIVALSLMAIGLLVGFNASVSGLIPLYTLGVFIAFTLSQGGMLVRWWRRHEAGWRRGLAINGLGAVTTAVVALVVGSSNFLQGAWLVIVLVPLLMLLLRAINGHYRDMDSADGARDRGVTVSGADRSAAGLHGRPSAPGPGSADPGGARRVRAEALVGELPPQPDRAAPQAATLRAPQHDRGRRALPRTPGVTSLSSARRRSMDSLAQAQCASGGGWRNPLRTCMHPVHRCTRRRHRMRTRSRLPLALAAVLGMLAALVLSTTALAAETILTAELAGSAETDEDGTGSAMLTLDPDAGTACWELTAEGIDPVTVSHIHEGAEGEDGPVVVDLDLDGFEGSSEGCTEGVPAETLQAIVDDQSAYYVNLHNEAFPGGAIRGQLVGASEPPDTALPLTDGSTGLLGAVILAIAAGLGLRAWRPATTRD